MNGPPFFLCWRNENGPPMDPPYGPPLFPCYKNRNGPPLWYLYNIKKDKDSHRGDDLCNRRGFYKDKRVSDARR